MPQPGMSPLESVSYFHAACLPEVIYARLTTTWKRTNLQGRYYDTTQ